MDVAIILALSYINKLSPYVILYRKTVPKDLLPRGIIVTCKPIGWMNRQFMKDWLAVVWNRMPVV